MGRALRSRAGGDLCVQDDVVRTIVAILAAHVRRAEAERTRTKPPNSWQAYDWYLQAVDVQHSISASFRVEDLYEARRLLQKSLAIDPNYARSFAMLAHSHIAVWNNRLDSDFLKPAALDPAYQFARKAVELDPNLPEAHAAFGVALMFRREVDASIAEFERAVALNPNYVDWRFGAALVFAGDPRRAIDVVKAYMRLDPYYFPFAPGLLGLAHYMLREYAEALAMLRDCVSRAPRIRSGHVFLAATYAQMGRHEEARAAVAEVLCSSSNVRALRYGSLKEYRGRCRFWPLWGLRAPSHSLESVQFFLLPMVSAARLRSFLAPPSRPTYAVFEVRAR